MKITKTKKDAGEKQPVTHLALLRGINVGGNNIIKMTALKEAFEKIGFESVQTYIQSGNVVFAASDTEETLEAKIEKALSKAFSYDCRAMVVSKKKLQQIVDEAPRGFGKEPEKYRYDVIFLKKPLTPTKALAASEVREGVDEASAGKHAVYFKRLIAKATHSKLPKIIGKPEYKYMTIRNWNTTAKLLALMS